MDNSDLLSCEECKKIVKEYLQTSHFEVVNFSIIPLSEGMMGFLGEHWKVKVTVHKNGENLDLQFFAKTLPKRVLFHTNFVLSLNAFEKEVAFYSLCAPHLKTPSGWAPECYFTRNDLVVLEDLSLKGFRMLDSRKPMDFEHCSVLLRTLAHLHAACIIFEEKESKASGKLCRLDQMYPDLFQENLFVQSELNLGSGWFRASIKAMLALLQFVPKYGPDTENFNMIKERLPKVCWKMVELVKPSKEFRNVVCEGDLWTNNVMFRYDEGALPTEAKLIDYQLVRYSPPALEIAFFLHTATSRELRKLHASQLLRVYYEELGAQLLREGLELEQVLPWAQFVASWEELRIVGRIVAPAHHQLGMMQSELLLPNVTIEENFTKFMVQDRDSVVSYSFKTDPVYRKWLTDDLEEFIEYCILDNTV